MAALQCTADQRGQVDWTLHAVDGTIVRAHQHAAGGRRGAGAPEALGRSRGGLTTKINLRVDRHGHTLCVRIVPGQQHDAVGLDDLLNGWSVRRPGAGRPRSRPQRLVADKAYTGRRIRGLLCRRGIRYTIPRLSSARRRGPFDRAIYRERNVVERAINRLKQFRGIATRYAKLAVNFVAEITLACIVIWLQV